MCVNYITVSRQLAFEWFRTPMETNEEWRDELYQDYRGPIILPGADGGRTGVLASYGLIPQPKLRAGLKLTTMNARSETVGSAQNYKRPWAESQLCLVPMLAFFEPNWEQGTHVRYPGLAWPTMSRSPLPACTSAMKSLTARTATRSHS